MFSPFYYKVLPTNLEPNKKTLVISLNKTIINYNYKMGTGFQVTKRPGLDKFLFDLSNKYEIVIFGDCEDISVINLFKYIYNIYLY